MICLIAYCQANTGILDAWCYLLIFSDTLESSIRNRKVIGSSPMGGSTYLKEVTRLAGLTFFFLKPFFLQHTILPTIFQNSAFQLTFIETQRFGFGYIFSN